MMMLLLVALTAQHPDTAKAESWAPHRVYDSHRQEFSDFEALAAEASRSDIVFLGEQHDDAGTHRMELALMQAIARRRGNVVLTLEMFERDVQPILDQYLAGTISEETFLKNARPWPAYVTDYRPLIEFAKAHGWKVVAGNVPRPMVGMAGVAGKGLEAITQRSDSDPRLGGGRVPLPARRLLQAIHGCEWDRHPMGDRAAADSG